jgi:hypothetical protein
MFSMMRFEWPGPSAGAKLKNVFLSILCLRLVRRFRSWAPPGQALETSIFEFSGAAVQRLLETHFGQVFLWAWRAEAEGAEL